MHETIDPCILPNTVQLVTDQEQISCCPACGSMVRVLDLNALPATELIKTKN